MNRTRRKVIKVILLILCMFTIILIFSRFIKRWAEEKLFEEVVKWVER